MKALIFGITGQDGSYLANFLLRKGYEVTGVKRWTSDTTTGRITDILPLIKLVEGDVTDYDSVLSAIQVSHPDEIYNLAAISTAYSPVNEAVVQVCGVGPLHIYDAVKQLGGKAKIYQASSSEMLDLAKSPQDESTPFKPANVYGCAKLMAHHAARLYRQKYGMFISCGILFNHESPRRPEQFVSRKITSSAVRIAKGMQKKLELWDLKAYRDWGFAKEYVEAMWAMLQTGRPDDYVIGTGKTHTVQEFVELAFNHVGLDWKEYVTASNPQLHAPIHRANPCRALKDLGWKAQTSFEELVHMMVRHDWKVIDNLPTS